jgi:hypothetical protein
MTVYEAVSKAKEMRPSEVTDEQMANWLSALDGQIWEEVVSQYDDRTEAEPREYTDGDVDDTVRTEMLVQHPYDDMYVAYLIMRIDLYNADYERYNNEAVLFNEIWQRYVNWYNRSHVHKSRVERPENGQRRTWLQF